MIDFDPYAELGIECGASEEQVQKAYRRMAMQLHPDLHTQGSQDYSEAMTRLNQARDAILEVTKDPLDLKARAVIST